MRYFLGLDEGTTGTTAVIFDEQFRPLARGYREHTQYYPETGWVEHDAEEIFNGALLAVKQALDIAGLCPADIAAIGVDHEGESVVAWDRETGRPVSRCIVWQDRRTEETCARMNDAHGDEIEACTGLRSGAYFSASKIAWILQNTPDMTQKDLCVGDMGCYIIFRLTGGKSFVTDPSTASRTMLMDLASGAWSAKMLALWNIPPHILPEIRDSIGVLGQTSPDVFFGVQTPVSGLLCDQQAALFGHGCLESGSAKITYGTGCFMLMNVGDTPKRSQNGLLPTVAWRADGKLTYALDGGAYIAGAAVQWLRDGLKLIENAAQTETLAGSVEDSGGVIFVPAFAGLAAPHWDDSARGLLIGLTGGTTAAHVVRAVLEGCAYQAADLMAAMAKDAGKPITAIRCDGGMTHNQFLMQFQADITGVPVIVPDFADLTARGSAMAAARGIGATVRIPDEKSKTFTPKMSQTQRDALCARWKEAVRRSKHWQ